MTAATAAFNERLEFSERLRAALVAAKQPTTLAAFARGYNVRAAGQAVSVHAARKWLFGESIPTQEKIIVLARWLNVSAAWLRFGDDGLDAHAPSRENGFGLSTAHLVLIQDVKSLSPALQLVVRELVNSLLVLAASTGRPATAAVSS